MFYVYVLESTQFNKRYIGLSSTPNKRLAEHNQGKTKSTKAFRPWQLVYQEVFQDRSTARQREKYFKSGTGREYLNKILNDND
jgi:putative endonuclease